MDVHNSLNNSYLDHRIDDSQKNLHKRIPLPYGVDNTSSSDRPAHTVAPFTLSISHLTISYLAEHAIATLLHFPPHVHKQIPFFPLHNGRAQH